ncbi:unnamed protein product [Anisakis simplex]|uniref:TNF receptor-associated factor 2 n=1 Tax=Anisakis simplex TaxID=6269 RepID=A0A0M3K796_ANISI|nr:unnamed protein product [Anisakis simplex]
MLPPPKTASPALVSTETSTPGLVPPKTASSVRSVLSRIAFSPTPQQIEIVFDNPLPKPVKDSQLQKRIQQLPVKCSFFDNGCTWTGILKQLQICPLALIDCPNKCGVCEMTREQIAKHLPDCPKAGSSCPFSEFGCQYRGGREMLQQHIQEEPIRHLTLLCDGVLDLKMLLANMELSMETMGTNLETLQKKCATLEKLYGSQMIWRIDNVKQKQNEARSGTRSIIFSPPFASARHGYKMVLSVSLYGDGQVRGEYMSAFISIMRGEFDALLEWPFTNQIKITLLDQNEDISSRNNIEYVIKPTPIAAHKSFLDRPISERNASFGAVRFCELDIVEKYIRDDVMFIKVDVDNSKTRPF